MSKGLVSFEYDDDVGNASVCSDQVDEVGSDLNDSLSAESDFEPDIKPSELAADATSVTLLAEALAADASRTDLPTALLQTRVAVAAPTIAKLDGTSICQACNLAVARYRCPACSTLSCSLACINQHKSEDSCSGQRNRTTFVPLSSFDDQLLMEDYNYLEEVSRCVDMSKRDPLARAGARLLPGRTQGKPFGRATRPSEQGIDVQTQKMVGKLHWLIKEDERRSEQLKQSNTQQVHSEHAPDSSIGAASVGTESYAPLSFVPLTSADYDSLSELFREQLVDQALRTPNVRTLQRECRSRGILLRCAPQGMKRHSENTTIVAGRHSSRCIQWRVEWLFSAVSLKHVDNRLNENLSWGACFGTLLGLSVTDPWLVPAADVSSDSLALLPADRRTASSHSALQAQLHVYRSQPSINELALLIAAPNRPANDHRFIELSWHQSIRSSLHGLSINEFPSVHVVLRTALNPAADCDFKLLSVSDLEHHRKIVLAATHTMNARSEKRPAGESADHGDAGKFDDRRVGRGRYRGRGGRMQSVRRDTTPAADDDQHPQAKKRRVDESSATDLEVSSVESSTARQSAAPSNSGPDIALPPSSIAQPAHVSIPIHAHAPVSTQSIARPPTNPFNMAPVPMFYQHQMAPMHPAYGQYQQSMPMSMQHYMHGQPGFPAYQGAPGQYMNQSNMSASAVAAAALAAVAQQTRRR